MTNVTVTEADELAIWPALYVVAAIGAYLARSPAFRAYRRSRQAIGEDGLAHRQRHQDPRLS